jgi:hypothetical protein
MEYYKYTDRIEDKEFTFEGLILGLEHQKDLDYMNYKSLDRYRMQKLTDFILNPWEFE